MADNTGQRYEAEITEVFSGDDLGAMIDLKVEGLHKKQRIRLQGVDTPSAIGQGPTTTAGSIRAIVRNMTKGKRVTLDVVSRGANTWIAVVHIHEGTSTVNLNQYLKDSGYAFTGRQ